MGRLGGAPGAQALAGAAQARAAVGLRSPDWLPQRPVSQGCCNELTEESAPWLGGGSSSSSSASCLLTMGSTVVARLLGRGLAAPSRRHPLARSRRRLRLPLRARECGSYSFEEAGRYNEEVRIYVPLGEQHTATDVDFDLRDGQIRVGLKGKPPAVEGKLWKPVEMEDSDWMIDAHEGRRSILVTLTKVNVREGWDHLLQHEAKPEETAVRDSSPMSDKDYFGPPLSNKTDMAVLEQLDRVQALLQQKRIDDARELLRIMTADLPELPGMPTDAPPEPSEEPEE